MHNSNNTFLIVYGNTEIVKWKICAKCGFLLEKSGQKWNYEIFVKLSKFVEKNILVNIDS